MKSDLELELPHDESTTGWDIVMSLSRTILLVPLMVGWSVIGAQPPVILLGSPAPENAKSAVSKVSGELMLVAFIPRFSDPASCKREVDAYARILQDLPRLPVAGLVPMEADATAQVCGYNPMIPLLSTAGHAQAESRTTLLLDRDCIVRRITRAGAADEHAERVIREVKAWQDGRAIYEAQCARCHGSDGKDTGYLFIKSLGGIGNRHSEKEIWRLTVATDAVDLSRLTAKERTALSIYVAGL